MQQDSRSIPYLPNTQSQRQEMLAAVGAASVEELFRDIPQAHRSPSLDLPAPLSELELRQELEDLAARNADTSRYSCFLGAGAYHHFVPAVVQHVTARGEFATAYTPYQPEVAQGTLQTTYEFQSLACLLFHMEVANAGMYDGATALAEAALMACRVTGRERIGVLDTLSPRYRQVVETYTLPQGLKLDTVSPQLADLPQDVACLLVQHPNFYGYLEDTDRLRDLAHGSGALLVVSMNPIAMGMLQPPGDHGADIAVAEAQPLGVPLSFGGPYMGLFTCRERFLRQMPGRIVGRTTDTRGRTGYVLTLQTREQHIRRERATSNICTSEALIGLAVTSYLATLGPEGMRQVAELCYHKAHYLASRIAELPGYSLPLSGSFFNEFVVQCPRPPQEVNQHLLERGIIGGLDISDHIPGGMLLCATEMNPRQELDSLVEALGEVG